MESETLTSIADHLPIGVMLFGERGRLLSSNRLGLEMLGLDENSRKHEDFASLLEDADFRRAVSNGGDRQVKLEISSAGRVLLADIQPVPEKKARLVVLKEVTGLSGTALTNKNLIFDILHRLRTPLTTIVSVLSLATSGRLDLAQVNLADLLSMGNREADRLTGLLTSLRDLFLIEGGSLRDELNMQPVPLAASMGRATAGLRSQFAAKRQTLVEEYPAEELQVLADPSSLTRVLEMVLLNATSYTPERGTIRFRAEQAGDHVRILIADDGAGIGEEELPRVFQRFYRGRSAQRSAVAGEGLGLYLARHLLLAQAGSIHLNSRLDEGTEVEIHLAVVREDD